MKKHLSLFLACLLVLLLVAGLAACGQTGKAPQHPVDAAGWLVFEEDDLLPLPLEPQPADEVLWSYVNACYMAAASFEEVAGWCGVALRARLVQTRNMVLAQDDMGSWLPYEVLQFEAVEILSGEGLVVGETFEVRQMARGPVELWEGGHMVETNAPFLPFEEGSEYVLLLQKDPVGRYGFYLPGVGVYSVQPGGAINPLYSMGVPYEADLLS